MNATDPTVANTNLWAAYLDAEARKWLPRSAAQTVPSDGAATLLSDVMTALWGGFISQLFQANAPEVTRFVAESHATQRQHESDLALLSEAGLLADVTPEDASAEAWLPEISQVEFAGAQA